MNHETRGDRAAAVDSSLGSVGEYWGNSHVIRWYEKKEAYFLLTVEPQGELAPVPTVGPIKDRTTAVNIFLDFEE